MTVTQFCLLTKNGHALGASPLAPRHVVGLHICSSVIREEGVLVGVRGLRPHFLGNATEVCVVYELVAADQPKKKERVVK